MVILSLVLGSNKINQLRKVGRLCAYQCAKQHQIRLFQRTDFLCYKRLSDIDSCIWTDLFKFVRNVR